MEKQDSWERVEACAAKWFGRFEDLGATDHEIVLLDETPSLDSYVGYGRTATLALPVARGDGKPLGVSVDDIRSLFFTPAMLRLNYVAQLSTTYLRANLDAKHTRLSHAIGTVIMLSSFVEVILERIQGEERLERCIPTKLDIASAYTYAALHDAFQGPFGHSLDPLRDCLLPSGYHTNRRLDKALFSYIAALATAHTAEAYENHEQLLPPAIESLVTAVETCVAKPLNLEVKDIFEWMIAVIDRPQRNSHMNRIGWLLDLLEGPFDADRWDYLWRDTLHLGFGDHHRRIKRSLEDFWNNVTIHYQHDESYLMVGRSVANTLGQDFLRVRRELYQAIYEHVEKRLIDESLNRCVYVQLFQDFKIPSSPEEWFLGSYPRKVTDFAHLTDGALLEVLEAHSEAHSEDEALMAMSSMYARELQMYPTFGVAQIIEVELEATKDLLKAVQEFKQRENAQRTSDQPLTAPKLVVQATIKQTQERLEAQRSHLKDIGVLNNRTHLELLLHAYLVAYNPAASLQFARIIWKGLRERTDVGSIIRRLMEASVTARLENFCPNLEADAVLAAIQEFPPIFVTFPWLPNPDIFGVATLTKTPQKELLAIQEENGMRVVVDAGGLIPRGQADDALVFAVGYPLFAVHGLEEHQLELLRGAIEELSTAVLATGCCLMIPDRLRGSDYDEVLLAALGW